MVTLVGHKYMKTAECNRSFGKLRVNVQFDEHTAPLIKMVNHTVRILLGVPIRPPALVSYLASNYQNKDSQSFDFQALDVNS